MGKPVKEEDSGLYFGNPVSNSILKNDEENKRMIEKMGSNRNMSAKVYDGYVVCGGYRFSFEELDNSDYYDDYIRSIEDIVYGSHCIGKGSNLMKRLEAGFESVDERLRCYQVAKQAYIRETFGRKELHDGYQRSRK